jgi:hypothetical protein
VNDENAHWQAVTVLARLSAAADRLKSVLVDLEHDLLDPEVLHQRLVQSKVVRLALSNLTALALDSRGAWLCRLLQETDSRERKRHAMAWGPMRQVVELAATTGARIIKGLSMLELYPNPRLRHIGDIDVHTPDFGSSLAFASQLRLQGWVWDIKEYPWVKWDEAGILYGQLALLLWDHEGERVSRADLHFGAYSVGHGGRMPLIGWRSGQVLGVPVSVPTRESGIALVAAHALGDTTLSMKDINDLHVLIGSEVLDWSSVVEICHAAQAQEVLGQLLRETGTVYPRDGLPGVGGSALLRPGGLPQGDRSEHFARHARRDERARGTAEEQGERISAEAHRYFGTDLRPRLSEGVLSPPPMAHGRHLCWRLLPQQVWSAWDVPDASATGSSPRDEVLAPGLTLTRGEHAAVVRMGAEHFIPTVWGDVHPESVALARQLAGAVA